MRDLREIVRINEAEDPLGASVGINGKPTNRGVRLEKELNRRVELLARELVREYGHGARAEARRRIEASDAERRAEADELKRIGRNAEVGE